MSAFVGAIPRLADLPQSLPIFPLTGVILMPHGRLPLNVFEPRYLALVEDALGAPGRLVGMIQPREPGSEGMTRGGIVPPSPPLYTTGCAGRISMFSETDDNRYLITLVGVCRFEVAEELPETRGYRRVVPNFRPWQADLEPPGTANGAIDRESLMRPLRAYFAARNITTDWDAVAQTPDDRLVITLAMNCPFEPQERQALLQCKTMPELTRAVTTLLEMATTATPGSDPAKH
jgi:Lon protease-like protein